MTVIRSKVERSYWKKAALSVIPDLLIAWAVTKYMNGGAEVFFGTLIGLQAGIFGALGQAQRVELASILVHQSVVHE